MVPILNRSSYQLIGISSQDTSKKIVQLRSKKLIHRLINLNLIESRNRLYSFSLVSKPQENLSSFFFVSRLALNNFLKDKAFFSKISKVVFLSLFCCSYLLFVCKLSYFAIGYLKLFAKSIILVQAATFSEKVIGSTQVFFECFVAIPFLVGLSKLVMTILLMASVKLVTEDPYNFKASLNELYHNLNASLLFASFSIIKKNIPQLSESCFDNRQYLGFFIDPINQNVILKENVIAPRYVILPRCVLSIEGLVTYYLTKKRIDGLITHPIEKNRLLTLFENKRCLNAMSQFFSCTESEIVSISDASLNEDYKERLGESFSSCQKLYRLHLFFEQIALEHPRFEPLSLLKPKDAAKIRDLNFKAKRVLLSLMPKLNII